MGRNKDRVNTDRKTEENKTTAYDGNGRVIDCAVGEYEQSAVYRLINFID